jgi:hypothetical protein
MTKEDKELLDASRKELKICIEDEESERKKMLDDLKFCALDQWDPAIKKSREGDVNGARPCLTIDKINQYVVQVTNDIRQNHPGMKVRPVDNGADPETADVFQGVLRHIEDQSNAQIAYHTAVESAVKIGLGYFRVVTDYTSPDSFDQEIFIRRIADTFSVHLGEHEQPDGSDAACAFITSRVPIEEFKRQYPKATTKDEDFSGLDDVPYWKTKETITVVERFYKHYETKELVFLEDGQTFYRDEYTKIPGKKPAIKDLRETTVETVKWCKLTGAEVLEKRDWAGKYIPIVEVIGKESHVEGKRLLWGLVRPAKDSLRMYNYWASTVTEKIGLAPKAPFIAAEGQMEGHENEWARANVDNRAVLTYKAVDVNGNALPAPKRVDPAPMEAAMMGMMQTIDRDVKGSLGMYKAAVGDTDSQQSGRAILALQRESDTGTYHFSANLADSIRHLGRILVDLAPKIYDTRRVLRILGEDGESSTVTIDPDQEESKREIQTNEGIKRFYNIGVGKFDVTITVGPSYNTKRMEAAEVMLEMVKSQPQMLQLIGHIMFRNMDFPGADEIAKIMKKMMPPQLQDEEDQPQIPPQVAAQMQQMQQALQLQGQELQKAQAGENQAVAKIQTQHAAKMQELALREQVEKEEARLAREKAEAEIALKRWIAEQELAIKRGVASAEIRQGAEELAHHKQMDRAELSHDMQVDRTEMAHSHAMDRAEPRSEA